MRRTALILFALLASLLAMTAMPAAAANASASLEVASKNTTDTDFSSATLTNMSVTGSGDSASVVIDKVGGYDISTASFDSSFSVSGQDGGSREVAFNDDGSKMFIVGNANNNIYQYSLSTAFDSSTASYSKSFDVATQSSFPTGLTFGDSGAKMYVTDRNDDNVYEYDLSTPYDIGTASYVQSFDVSAQVSASMDVEFKSGGSVMYVVDQGGTDVEEYSISSAWDISSASHAASLDVSGQASAPTSVWVRPDGTELWVTGSTSASVHDYNLGTAYDVSSGTYDQSFDVSSQDSGPTGVAFGDGGQRMYITGYDSDAVHEYSLDEGSAAASGQYLGANHSVDASRAWANLSVKNASATITIQEFAGGGWVDLNSTSVSTTGNHTVNFAASTATVRVKVGFASQSGATVAQLHDEGVLFDASAPVGSDASPTGNTSSYSGNTELDVNDSDFATAQGDTVTAEAYNTTDGNNSLIGSTTLNSNGTASIAYSPIGGQNSIRWELNDSYGQTDQVNQTFGTPATLFIRNESAPTNLITAASVDITWYSTNTSLESTTSDGTVSLDGLPVDEKVVGVITAEGYYSRHIIIQSFFQQQSAYLLNDNVTAVEDRFTLSDQSGQFEADESEVIIKRPLTRDYDGDGSNETRYETIAADEFGVAGYSLFLEESVRYRIAVRDAEDYQVLGPYTADVSETVALRPGEFQIAINESAEGFYAIGFYETYEAGGGDHQRLTFEYYDAEGNTDQLELAVVEQGNRSNQLEPNQTIDGPLTTTSVNYNLTDAEANKTWIIVWSATRGSETVNGEEIVGQHIQDQAANFPQWIKEASAAIVIILTLALFSRVNRETGAVTASMVGGGFWFAGWLPPAAGGAVVVALAVSIVTKTGLPEV